MLMITPLKKVHLYELYKEPILFDANIFMVGIEKRSIDDNCSFDNMKKLYILPLFEKFQCIYIHEEVYKELDVESKRFIDSYIGKNVTIVGENGLYGKDPLYTTIFQNISNHELVNYTRGNSNNKALRSVYKKYCADVIRRHRLPGTLKEYIEKSRGYI